MEEEIKVKKFSGELEDYPTWKREFTNKMGIKDLADFMLDPHPNPPGKQATADEKEAHNKKMKKLYWKAKVVGGKVEIKLTSWQVA